MTRRGEKRICPKCKRLIYMEHWKTICNDCFFVYRTMNNYRPPNISESKEKTYSDYNVDGFDGWGSHHNVRRLLEDDNKDED